MTVLNENDLNDLAGDFPASFKFVEVGDSVAGTITHIRPPVAGETDMQGKPVDNYIFRLETDDGTSWSIWAKVGSGILRSIAKAGKEGGGKIETGGRLGIQFTALGEPPKPGFNSPKIFVSAYKPPTGKPSAVSASDLI